MISTSEDPSPAAGGSYDAQESRRVGWRRPPKSLTTSIVDIDVALTDIVSLRNGNGLASLGARRPTSVLDCALEGVVPAAALAIEDDRASAPRLVYVSGYAESDRMDRDEDFDQRSVCYIAADRGPDHAWRTNIYIECYIFSRLVELYASKRIDYARISILIKVLQDPSGAIALPTLSHPMLRTAGDRLRQQSRAHLMSVQTSLGAAAQVHPAAWGERAGGRPRFRNFSIPQL